MIFRVQELLLSDFCVFGFFVEYFWRRAIIRDFAGTSAVLPEVNGPSDIFFGGVRIFDEMPKLGNVFGHDGVTIFSGLAFFHS